MKTRFFFLLIPLVFCSFQRVAGQDTLLLFHPTAYNLKVVQNLMDEGIISLNGYHLLGVYHELEAYDYDDANAYIELLGARNMSLQKVTGSLEPGVLFGENSCTEQFEQLFNKSNGALFMGGPDIPPVVYSEHVHLLTEVTDPFRHFFEVSYLFHLLGGVQDPGWNPYLDQREKYLISGICLGMQTLNVATGGTLVQDIPTELYGIWLAEELLDLPPEKMHRNYADKLNSGCDEPTSYHFHPVKLMKNSMLVRDLGFRSQEEPLVLSSHHQAVEKLGKGWKIGATSMDGKVVEAIEHEQYPHVFGVQFHPEKPGLFDPVIEHPISCNSTINFQEAIKNTDSYSFHLAYWKYLGTVLQKSREN